MKNEQTNRITADVAEKINELNMYVKNIDKITLVLRNIATDQPAFAQCRH